ncbi:hypothetical protein ACQJBY_063855 [Aegilops geniculata]
MAMTARCSSAAGQNRRHTSPSADRTIGPRLFFPFSLPARSSRQPSSAPSSSLAEAPPLSAPLVLRPPQVVAPEVPPHAISASCSVVCGQPRLQLPLLLTRLGRAKRFLPTKLNL